MPLDDLELSCPVASLEDSPDALSDEERERQEAWRRGAAAELSGAPETAARVSESATGLAARAFVALAENVRDYAVFLMDPRGVITFWGEGARLIKWWTKAEAEGGHLRLLYPSGGAEDGTAEAHLRQAAAQGEYTGEGRRVRSDGSTFWAGITLTALYDATGQLLGFAKVTRDLTARRAADSLLQSAAASAEEARRAADSANLAKSGFLATMSHEIRTPVNAIMGYLDLLSLDIGGSLTSEQRSYVERAGRGSRHLLALVSDVLDFSRLEAERQPVARRMLRVGDAVSHALGLVVPQARARRVRITDAVSGAAGGLVAWGDEARVSQIVANLLINAVKFTDPRTEEPGRITISAGTATEPASDTLLAGDGPWIYIRVEDTGLGIPPDQLEAIFEPFVQGDMSLTRRHGGTGLGLAISRRLARAMGGEVIARSDIGVGSTFFLWLPAAPVQSVQSGGIAGSGPGEPRDAAADAGATPYPISARGVSVATNGDTPPTTFRVIADALLAGMEPVLDAYVARLRGDPDTPSANTLERAQIEDHFASLVADLAATIGETDAELGAPDAALSDGTAIQRVIATRHGVQRARLRWAEQEIHREFQILHEEITAALHARCDIPAAALEPGERSDTTRAIDLVTRFLRLAETISVTSYRSARAGREGVERPDGR